MATQTSNGTVPGDGSLHENVDPQLSSPFFALPAEVRNLIYAKFWALSSTRQHIDSREIQPDLKAGPEAEPTLVWTHLPCITDPCAEDVRPARFSEAAPGSPEMARWTARLKSDWCLHWACQEQDPDWVARRALALWGKGKGEEGNGTRSEEEGKRAVDEGMGNLGRELSLKLPRSGYLDILTTCKRMYHESLPSLYGNTTFIFTDTPTTERFLSLYAPFPDRFPIRSLELCIRVTNLLTELYYPPLAAGGGDEGPPPVFAGRARPGLTARDNPWQRVCDRLVALPRLRELRVWVDTRDLRPWHKRVSEARFFGRLLDVRGVPDRRRFVLALPELRERRGPDHEALAGHFLEGEVLEKAPFTVERGPRPNNWLVHLTGRV